MTHPPSTPKDPNFRNYFLSEGLDDICSIQETLSMVLTEFQAAHNTSGPVVSPKFNIAYADMPQVLDIPTHTAAPLDVVRDLLPYYQNCINWNHAGAMFNVTPPVNILAIALNVVTQILNPNIAEDRSSGMLAGLESSVVKAIGGLAGWKPQETGGMMCFGGKATNLYAIRTAIENCRRHEPSFKVEDGFYLIGEKGHPCQGEVADLLAISPENVIVVPSLLDGRMDVNAARDLAINELSQGKTFLGLTVNAGTTQEFIVDDIPEFLRMRDKLQHDYQLQYKPLVHADAVLGWVWLFLRDQNKVELENKRICPEARRKLDTMYDQVRHLRDVDSFGVDFHKLGYAAYQSSFFLSRHVKQLITDNLKFGGLSPYKNTIELSRAATGVISAAVGLKSLGYSGYVNILTNLVDGVERLRERLDSHPNVMVLDRDSNGVCMVFTLKSASIASEHELIQDDVTQMIAMNQAFVGFVQERLQRRETSLYFSYSRSYRAPGSTFRYSGIKVYPTSVHLNLQRVDDIADALIQEIDMFLRKPNAALTSDLAGSEKREGVLFHPIF